MYNHTLASRKRLLTPLEGAQVRQRWFPGTGLQLCTAVVNLDASGFGLEFMLGFHSSTKLHEQSQVQTVPVLLRHHYL